VFWVEVQLGDCYRNMVDNLHFEEYFQRDSKKGLGARYVV
jgi:hypothetical protein